MYNRNLKNLAMVNLGIWAMSIIALVFVIQDSSAAKGMFPVLGGGIAVGIALAYAASRSK